MSYDLNLTINFSYNSHLILKFTLDYIKFYVTSGGLMYF